MEVKECYNCKKVKKLSEFSKNSSKPDGLQTQCKCCHKEYRRKHYLKNKVKISKQVSLRKKSIRDYVTQHKENHGCNNCGDKRHWVLDLHHIDSKTKLDSVSNLIRLGSLSKVEKELSKCEVLCSNCHRDLHYKMREKS